MKLRITALAAAAVVAVPATAPAAELRVEPERRCYGSGQTVNLLGTGFSPDLDDGILVTRRGMDVGELDTDANGAFHGTLTLGQPEGRRTSTYVATDTSDPALTASAQIVVSELDVRLRPERSTPGERVTISAVGFTLGSRRLYAHVTRGNSTRTIRIGRLKGPCGRLERRRRLLPAGARPGVYTVQFDAFRRYRERRSERPQRIIYTITVQRVS